MLEWIGITNFIGAKQENYFSLISLLFKQEEGITFSKSLRGSGGDRSQGSVDLGRRAAENQVANGSLGDLDVLERSEDVDLRVGEHDPRLGDILDGVLRPASFAGQSSDAPGQVVALKGLDVLDVEGVQVEVVQPDMAKGSSTSKPRP